MRINFDFQDIRAFCTLASIGQFTAAAEVLSLTTSALSRRIAKLEDALGGRLFDRTTRRISLNSAGVALYEQAAPLVRAMDDCVLDVSRRARGAEGQLVVAAVASIGYAVFPLALSQFYQQHPNIYLSLRDGHASFVNKQVEDNVAEFGITSSPALSATLVSEHVTTYTYQLAFSEGNALFSGKDNINWRELKGLPVTGLNPASSTRQKIDAILLANDIELPWINEVDQISSVIGLIQSGNFYSVLPGLINLSRYGLRGIPISSPDISTAIFLIKRKDTILSTQGRSLWNAIKEQLSP